MEEVNYKSTQAKTGEKSLSLFQNNSSRTDTFTNNQTADEFGKYSRHSRNMQPLFTLSKKASVKELEKLRVRTHTHTRTRARTQARTHTSHFYNRHDLSLTRRMDQRWKTKTGRPEKRSSWLALCRTAQMNGPELKALSRTDQTDGLESDVPDG